ncbi:NADH-quinone oxidoreductase subunit E [Streptococcus sanguinis SK330]|uniref:NADH-quinone oxidoreductase subunit E n=1 Tax=Streptococcus sanguinis SK330 TaxID=888813 RepID=F2CB22_STRSA|nr:NADH-quinone oxidoreductase subunit E [Streptococcus sanguinis SK330]
MLNIYYANVKEMDYNNLYDDFFEILSEEKNRNFLHTYLIKIKFRVFYLNY